MADSIEAFLPFMRKAPKRYDQLNQEETEKERLESGWDRKSPESLQVFVAIWEVGLVFIK